MPNNYVLLQRVEVGAAGAASVSFTNIPQTGYSDLKVVLSARTTRSAVDDAVLMRFNNSTTNFTVKELRGNGTSVVSSSPTVGFIGYVDGNTATANTFSNNEIYIPNYAGNTNKSFSIDGVAENNATFGLQGFLAGLWSQTAAITSIAFFPETGPNFLANSTFSLYAMAAVGVTPTVAPKASGGSITTDGTYWYHTFRSSGFFVPQTALTCELTIVSGGGGGGRLGGGGGAGGYSRLSSQSISVGNYSITIGAGGAAGTAASGQNPGFIGVASSINGTSSNPGGGGGGYGTSAPSGTYGSGGGGGYSDDGASKAGATGTTGQGNAGGTAGANFFAGGGGGGAGANGSNSILRGGGNGGTGISLGTDYTTATGLGVSGFVAGGGGGCGQTTGGTGTGGGGNGANNANGTTGTANTGGGGGGGYASSGAYDGSAGGSGVVIVRYLVA